MLRIPLLWLALFTCSSAQAEGSSANKIMIGAGGWSRPAYNGADTNHLSLIPVIRYYGKPWFARTTFGMLEGGARMEAPGGLILGGQLAYEGGRDSAESALLATHNIATLSPSLSWGVHAELEKKLGPMPLITLLRYRQDVENIRGNQTDLRLTAGIYGRNDLNAGIFAQATWADKKSANYYYGITAQQSSTSGLPAYEATNGEIFNSFGILWSYDLNPQWILLGSFESRLAREAVINSPLVQQSSNKYVSLGLAYQY